MLGDVRELSAAAQNGMKGIPPKKARVIRKEPQIWGGGEPCFEKHNFKV